MKCVDQQGKPVMPFGFCSEKTTVNPPGFKASFREGTVKKFDTVEALAKFYGAPLEPLKQQIAEWNKMVAAGKDELFGRPLDRRVELKAPFYAMRFWPKLHYCMGGIGINDQAQVISTKTCKPIPRLYAAGEITGGVHGLDRLGSCSSTDCLAMGRIAGRSVAANL